MTARIRTGVTWNRPTYARSQEAGASGERQGAARGPGRGHNGIGVARGSALCAWCSPPEEARGTHRMCGACLRRLMREAAQLGALILLVFVAPFWAALALTGQ